MTATTKWRMTTEVQKRSGETKGGHLGRDW
jgi:hypothetical protein